MYRIDLLPLKSITPTELHDPLRVHSVANMIVSSGLWTSPILVHNEMLFIMDGHHRYEAAKVLKLRLIPTIPLSYEDTRLSLSSWEPTTDVRPEWIMKKCAANELLPVKTTKHILSPPATPTAIPLSELL